MCMVSAQIAHRYSPARIYDTTLQRQVFVSIQPPRKGSYYGPSPYPPFVAMFFALIHIRFL